MPTEKAHGIQIAKMCEAFMDLDLDLTLVVPTRPRGNVSVREFYGLKSDIRITEVLAINWYNFGRVGYTLSTISFMLSYSLYLKRCARAGDIVYTVDLDHLAYGALPLLGIPFFSEMHGGKPNTFIHRALFKHALGIIATNSITKEQLQKMFKLPDRRLLVEPNGVDFSAFAPHDASAARAELGLEKDIKLALYIGRFFDWKGLGILAEAAPLLEGKVTLGMIGGTREEFKKVTGVDAPGSIVFYGEKPYTQIPMWASAADSLLVLGTKRDEQSYRYTSPMKVFEYMAMQRPIVASRTPALQDIVSDTDCFFYEPDNAHSLADAMLKASTGKADSAKIGQAFAKVQRYSWEARAKRILAFMEGILKMK